MKRLISLVLSFIIFLLLLILIIILNINSVTKYNTINNISKKVNYLNFIDIKSNKNEIRDNYNILYLSLEKANISKEIIEKIYKSDFFVEVTSHIIYKEFTYLKDPYNKKASIYSKQQLDRLVDYYVDKINDIDDPIKEEIKEIMKSNNNNIITIEAIIRKDIANTSLYKLKLLRYLLNLNVKIILLCLIIILMIVECLLNKEKLIPYIFVPTTLSSVFGLLIALFFKQIVISNVDEFSLNFIIPYIELFSKNLMFTSILIIMISIIYLMINEYFVNKNKKIIRPKIKQK